MATKCKSVFGTTNDPRNNNPKAEFTLCRTPRGSSADILLRFIGIYAPNLITPNWLRFDWTMELQRYYSHPGEGWQTIGTRSGYVTLDSPSPRTFTNIRAMNRRLRVVVRARDAGGHVGTFYSEEWVY